MTDRIKGLTVGIEPNMREDDCKKIIDAINLIKGVTFVNSHVSDIDHHLAVQEAKSEIESKLWAVLYPEKTPV